MSTPTHRVVRIDTDRLVQTIRNLIAITVDEALEPGTFDNDYEVAAINREINDYVLCAVWLKSNSNCTFETARDYFTSKCSQPAYSIVLTKLDTHCYAAEKEQSS